MEITLATQRAHEVGSVEVFIAQRIENGLALAVKVDPDQENFKRVDVKYEREVELGGIRWILRYLPWFVSGPVQLAPGTPVRMAILEQIS